MWCVECPFPVRFLALVAFWCHCQNVSRTRSRPGPAPHSMLAIIPNEDAGCAYNQSTIAGPSCSPRLHGGAAFHSRIPMSPCQHPSHAAPCSVFLRRSHQ